VELGAGAASKTERSCGVTRAAYAPRAKCPVDVLGDALASATRGRRYPALAVRACTAAMKACFRCCRGLLAHGVLVSSGARSENLIRQRPMSSGATCVRSCRPAISLLLGVVDLVKDAADDSIAPTTMPRWSAAFTKNIFARMNRRAGEAKSIWTASITKRRIAPSGSAGEIFARMTRRQEDAWRRWAERIAVEAGERVMTEDQPASTSFTSA